MALTGTSLGLTCAAWLLHFVVCRGTGKRTASMTVDSIQMTFA